MKKTIKDDSSSSEDESNIEALREATDQHFLKNSFFNNKSENNENNKKVVTNCEDKNVDDDQNQPEELHIFKGISQSCKDFIAKKLHQRLSENIVFEETSAPIKIDNNPVQESGIQLLKNSIKLSGCEEIPEDEKYQKRKRKKSDKFNEKKNLLMCKEIAVSPELILSQEDTKHWTTRKKGKEFKYKKQKNGTLEEIM